MHERFASKGNIRIQLTTLSAYELKRAIPVVLERLTECDSFNRTLSFL